MSSYGEDGRPHGYNSTIAELFVYNIEVEDFHTYYVDHFGLWVHNTNKCFNESNIPWTAEDIVKDVTIDKNKNGNTKKKKIIIKKSDFFCIYLKNKNFKKMK